MEELSYYDVKVAGVKGLAVCAGSERIKGKLEIPSVFQGKDVIAVAGFGNMSELTEVIIPEGVLLIKDAAFDKCGALVEVSLPQSLQTLGAAFNNCSKLQNIKIPKNVKTMRAKFSGCARLESIEVDAQNQSFCSVDGVVYNKAMTSLVIYPKYGRDIFIMPDTIKNVSNYAFQGCILRTIVFSARMTDISRHPLWYLEGVERFEVDTANKKLIGIDGVIYNKDCTELLLYPTFGEVADFVMPDSVKSVAEYAFRFCRNLKTITISANVSELGSQAFRDCYDLTAFVVDPSNPNFCSRDNVLFNKDQTVLIAYPTSGEQNYSVPHGVVTIGAAAFWGCKALRSIDIPDSVKAIEEYGFAACTGLDSITIPSSVATIGRSAFTDWSNRQTIKR